MAYMYGPQGPQDSSEIKSNQIRVDAFESHGRRNTIKTPDKNFTGLGAEHNCMQNQIRIDKNIEVQSSSKARLLRRQELNVRFQQPTSNLVTMDMGTKGWHCHYSI